MKATSISWGRARYGEKTGRKRCRDAIPALFIGMTGIDEEFRTREERMHNKGLYDTRLGQLIDMLGNVMTDFGGRGKPFTNVYPIRYPGTWDTDAAPAVAKRTRRNGCGPARRSSNRTMVKHSCIARGSAGTRPCATKTAGCR